MITSKQFKEYWNGLKPSDKVGRPRSCKYCIIARGIKKTTGRAAAYVPNVFTYYMDGDAQISHSNPQLDDIASAFDILCESTKMVCKRDVPVEIIRLIEAI